MASNSLNKKRRIIIFQTPITVLSAIHRRYCSQFFAYIVLYLHALGIDYIRELYLHGIAVNVGDGTFSYCSVLSTQSTPILCSQKGFIIVIAIIANTENYFSLNAYMGHIAMSQSLSHKQQYYDNAKAVDIIFCVYVEDLKYYKCCVHIGLLFI